MSDIPIASCEHWRLGCCPFCFDNLTQQLSDMTDDRDHWYGQARSLSQILAKDFLYRAKAALPPQEKSDANKL